MHKCHPTTAAKQVTSSPEEGSLIPKLAQGHTQHAPFSTEHYGVRTAERTYGTHREEELETVPEQTQTSALRVTDVKSTVSYVPKELKKTVDKELKEIRRTKPIKR